MTNKTYNPKTIEAKWSKIWDKTKAFKVDIQNAKKPFYNLAMFPYPSGEGLHMGHIIPYSGVDTYGRYLRMNGYDVFEPMGFDAFGIHSENFAIKKGLHPKTLISRTTRYFREKQMKHLGTLFDWEREVNTTDPNYYKWTQWLFIQMFKHGLAKKRKAPVTYCPSCKTVLSDEQTEVIKKTSPVIARSEATKQSQSKEITTLPAVARNDNEVSVTVCERCKTPIERKELEQWFFKITKYADKLLNNLNSLNSSAFGATKAVSKYDQEHGINWSEKTKNSQRNWIGKSEGINITYQVVDANGHFLALHPRGGIDFTPQDIKQKTENIEQLTITCFTTRPDTNFGATFIVLAPEHPFVKWILKQKTDNSKQLTESDKDTSDGVRMHSSEVEELNLTEITAYVQRATFKTEQERIAEGRKKTGVFTGFYAVNQLNNYKMPIWISDFVVSTVGTGAVVGVPGHDLRDFEFAQKFHIPVIRVVIGADGDTSQITKVEQVQEENGTMINSDFLNGLEIHEATKKIMDYFEQKGWGKRVVHFKLRDWCISRQRYWGPPIPMINCPKCGWQPVPEKDLPVLLPYIKDYQPTGEGKSPLAKDAKWMKVKCPKCGEWVQRETDVSDTFLDSAWYFLRYPSVGLSSHVIASPEGAWQSQSSKKIASSSSTPRNDKTGLPWDPQITRKWLPVDMYIGGHEHAVLHLMYSRFVTMALKDMGYIDFEEPFKRFFAHGLMTSEGAKMSKSRGNVVNPNQYLDKYGSDTLRMYILFMGHYDAGSDFRMAGIAGMHRFLKRIWTLVISTTSGKDTSKVKQRLNQENTFEVEELNKRLLSKMHKTIKKVGDDIGNLHFNTAIASIMEYYNVLSDASSVSQEAIKTLLLLLAPFAPFITEELWQQIAIKTPPRWQPRAKSWGMTPRTVEKLGIHDQPWPKFDPKFLEEEEVTIVVQVNGKIRDKITVNSQQLTKSDKDTSDGGCRQADSSEVEELKKKIEKLALASPRVQKYLAGQKHKKSIFVPGKLINFVV